MCALPHRRMSADVPAVTEDRPAMQRSASTARPAHSGVRANALRPKNALVVCKLCNAPSAGYCNMRAALVHVFRAHRPDESTLYQVTRQTYDEYVTPAAAGTPIATEEETLYLPYCGDDSCDSYVHGCAVRHLATL